MWQLLAKYEICELPVRVSAICAGEGVELYSYQKAAGLIDSLRLRELVTGNDGLAFCLKERRIILFDSSCSEARQRFTVAHELGHFLLGHVTELTGTDGLQRHMQGEKETQANIFASRLLAPLCVLWGMDIASAGELQAVCNISAEVAQYRYNRLCLIRQRNEERGARTGQGVLLSSGYERAVYRSFRPFIENYRASFEPSARSASSSAMPLATSSSDSMPTLGAPTRAAAGTK